MNRVLKYIVRDYCPTNVPAFEEYLNHCLKDEHMEVVSITDSGCGHLLIVFCWRAV
jgi:hypothetical protein